jgi:hypothetical protein
VCGWRRADGENQVGIRDTLFLSDLTNVFCGFLDSFDLDTEVVRGGVAIPGCVRVAGVGIQAVKSKVRGS